jgi:hypothetical protein
MNTSIPFIVMNMFHSGPINLERAKRFGQQRQVTPHVNKSRLRMIIMKRASINEFVEHVKVGTSRESQGVIAVGKSVAAEYGNKFIDVTGCAIASFAGIREESFDNLGTLRVEGF